MSREEIDCFVGIYVLAGAYRQHYRNIHYLFDPKHGFPAIKAAMSRTRFEIIKTVFRFDDRRTFARTFRENRGNVEIIHAQILTVLPPY